MGFNLADLLESVAAAVGDREAVVCAARGEVRVYRCFFCDRPTSRAYPRCKHCDAEQPDAL